MAEQKITLRVTLAHDAKAGVWHVAESDVPGLHLEAATAEELARKVDTAAPEMVELNLDEILARHGGRSGQVPDFMLRHTYNTPLIVAQ